jgi:hypothetical protein
MSTTTAGDLITKAFGKLLVTGIQDVLADADMQTGLDTLNIMLDSWRLDGLITYATTQSTKVLVGGTPAYTIGTGGDISASRPTKITDAFIRGSGVDYPLTIIGQAEWDSIPFKGATGIPRRLWYDPQYPLAVVNLYPTPLSSAYTLILNALAEIESFASTTEVFALPPGYQRAIIYNLALELAPDYAKTPDADTRRIAQVSLNALKRVNAKSVVLSIDPALRARGGIYDITSDGYR